jgi:hypothetical protein
VHSMRLRPPESQIRNVDAGLQVTICPSNHPYPQPQPRTSSLSHSAETSRDNRRNLCRTEGLVKTSFIITVPDAPFQCLKEASLLAVRNRPESSKQIVGDHGELRQKRCRAKTWSHLASARTAPRRRRTMAYRSARYRCVVLFRPKSETQAMHTNDATVP